MSLDKKPQDPTNPRGQDADEATGVDRRTALAFGALLHDVGKVIYRGSHEQGNHSQLGVSFLRDEVAPRNGGYEGALGVAIADQLRYHHAKALARASLPTDSLAYVTYFADNVSAGFDRKDEGDEGAGTQGAMTFDRGAKLRKIFNILNGHHDDNTIDHEDYDVIHRRLLDGLAAIPVEREYVNSLLALLEATTSAVPSSTDKSQLIDVSLYDHAKTTAAVALCIYDYLGEQGNDDYEAALFDKAKSQRFYAEPMFRFASIDMSGIQSFIYTISGDGALKQLRARSLYLELLVEDIVDELLGRLGLSRANLMYTGGGHAYLLLPNTAAVEQGLATFKHELDAWFVEKYRTDLYVAMASVPCSADDLANRSGDGRSYQRLYRQLSEQLSAQKLARYDAGAIGVLNFPEIAVADDSASSGDHSRECTECHRSDLHINADGKCPLCAELGSISKKLVEKDVFVVCEGDGGLTLPFGASLRMLAQDEYKAKKPNARRIYVKNQQSTGLNLATHLWMGDYTAEADNDQRMEAYARHGVTIPQVTDGKELGVERLGVLRADVDNLGATFVAGLPADKASISRSATLSRALSYFFKKKVNDILAQGAGGQGYQAQVIYSGGDDLFLLGNWDDVIHAAMDIREALDDFTGNGTLTLSAGIGIYPRTFPIARMAEETGELCDEAKLRCDAETNKVVKNAVALWTEQAVFGWDEFAGKVAPRVARLHEMFDANEKGKAFIYRLLQLLRDRSKGDQVSAPRIAYLLARSFEGVRGGDGMGAELYSWAMDDRERRYLEAALEWYVYEIRERGER